MSDTTNEELFKRFHLSYFKYYSKEDLNDYCRVIIEYNRAIIDSCNKH